MKHFYLIFANTDWKKRKTVIGYELQYAVDFHQIVEHEAKKAWISSKKVISKNYKSAIYGYCICKRMQSVCISNNCEYQLESICCRANIRWILHLLQVGRIRKNAWNLGFIKFQLNLTDSAFFFFLGGARGWKFSRYENLTLVVFFSLKNKAFLFDI